MTVYLKVSIKDSEHIYGDVLENGATIFNGADGSGGINTSQCATFFKSGLILTTIGSSTIQTQGSIPVFYQDFLSP